MKAMASIDAGVSPPPELFAHVPRGDDLGEVDGVDDRDDDGRVRGIEKSKRAQAQISRGRMDSWVTGRLGKLLLRVNLSSHRTGNGSSGDIFHYSPPGGIGNALSDSSTWMT